MQLQHVKEDISNTFFYESSGSHTLNLDTVELQIKSFERELETITDAAHVEAERFSACFELAIQHAWVCLYEVAIHLGDPAKGQGASSLDEASLISLATRKRNLTIQCLEKTKTHMDNYLKWSNYLFERTTVIYTSQLAYTAMILMKLTFSTTDGTPENPFPFRKICNIYYYAKNLADQCRDHDRSTCGDHCIANDLMHIYRGKARLMTGWFERLEVLNTTEGAENMKDLSSNHFEQISDQEQQLLTTDWSTIDFSQLDMSGMM